MKLLGVIFCIVLGAAFIGFAVAHEYTWWRRRKWTLGRGVVVGFTQGGVDDDGYFPEIEFEGQNGTVRFVSTYGSGSKPTLGKQVKLFIHEKGESAEQINMGTRFFFTLVPLLFGLIFVWMASHIKPIEPARQPPPQGHAS